MTTPRQRSFSTLSEMEVSPITGLAENLGGLRTDSSENTPLRRSKWPFNTPDALPSPKWPKFRRPSPDPSPTVVYGLLHDIGNTAAGSGFAEKPPKYLHNRKTLFDCSSGTHEASFDKENLPGLTEGPQCSSPCPSSRAKPSFPLTSQPSRQNSEDSGCPIELHTENRYALDAFGYVFDSFGDLRQSKPSCSSSDEGIRRSENSPMSSKDDSMSQKPTSWESGLPAASSARSSFLAAGDSEDGFPTTLEEFFQDVESHLPPRYNDLISAPLYSAPLSASVPRKTVGTPSFQVYCDGSPENSKEQIRRRLMLGSEDETVSSPPRRQNTPSAHKPGTPATPLTSLESVLNCNISIVKNPFKRPVSPGDGCASLLVKRQRSDTFQRVMSCNEPSCTTKVITLQRCHSENEASIKLALQKSEQQPDLIGDFSKPYALPLMKGKHDDLKMISPTTLAEVLQGKYNHSVKEYVVIDCRYPYEYIGGHISGAVNIYTREDLMSCFLPEKMTNQMDEKVLVFHCEFSSERGPKMSRFLRNMDRQMHNDMYPKLKYPEIYVLEGGYKAFFEDFKSLCVPETYVPMRHKDHESELKEFRARSKSGGSLKGLSSRTSKKF